MRSQSDLLECRQWVCNVCRYSSRGEANMHSRRNQQIWQYLRQHRVVSIVAGPLIMMIILSAFLFSSAGTTLFGAFAKSPCSSGDKMYVVESGDTLGMIAMRYNTTWH